MMTRRDFVKTGLIAGTVIAADGPGAVSKPANMITKAIPSTGERVPVIGLGTNRYGVNTSVTARAPLRAALNRFHELGGTVIDTAPRYGSSETVLGDLIDDLGMRDELFVATKTDKSGGRVETIGQMNLSLKTLRSGTVDLMQVHNLSGWKTALPVMREWKDAGRIRYVGITTSRQNQYADIEQVMRSEELDFIQVNYSLEQRLSADRLLPLAADRGMAVMINRGFGGGRIFDKVGDQPLPEWAKDFDCTSWAQFLLKYAISHPAATVAIPGMTKAHHVEDNIMAGQGRLPNDQERRNMESFYDAR